ncbi:MAG: hypothetical protein WDZ59_02340 [Pirellulales bacterium]
MAKSSRSSAGTVEAEKPLPGFSPLAAELDGLLAAENRHFAGILRGGSNIALLGIGNCSTRYREASVAGKNRELRLPGGAKMQHDEPRQHVMRPLLGKREVEVDGCRFIA